MANNKIVTTDNLMNAKPNLNPQDVPDDVPSVQTAADPVPPVDPVPTASESAEHKNDLQRMKEYFAAQPKVSVYIPESQDEHVIVNGYAFHLKRGEQVEVPVDVAEILRVSWKGRGRANERRQIETQDF